MAYGLKYQSDFYNFFGKLVSVKIYKKDYVGVVTSLRTSEVTIEANYEDDNTPVIGHGAKVVVRADTTDLTYLEDLLLSYEREFQCTITYGGTIAFRGFSLCDLNERQLLPYSAVTLQFTDYIHRLSEQYPVCLDNPEGKITLLRLVTELIDMTDIELSLYVNSTLFESGMKKTDIDTFLPQVITQNYQFYANADEYDNMYDAINKALQPFNAFIYYYNDAWVIERQEDVSRTGTWVMYSNTTIGDLALVAGTWVYLYGTIDYYPTGVYVQSWGNHISFTALVAGVNFSSPPTITNTGGDLSGTVATTTPNAGNALSVQFTVDSGSGMGLFHIGPCVGEIVLNTSGNYYADIEEFIAQHYDDWLAAGVTIYHTMSSVIQFDSSIALGGITYEFHATYGYPIGHFDVLIQGVAPVARVDTITLSGTNGTANIACNGVVRQITMDSASELESGFSLSDPSSIPNLRQSLNKQAGDFEYVDCSQIIEYDSGLKTLILKLNDTLYDSLVFNNYTEDMQTITFTDTTFLTFPSNELEYRTWYAHEDLTDIEVGKAYRGMEDWIKFTSDNLIKGLYYNFKVQFAISTDVPTVLNVSYKQTESFLSLGHIWIIPRFLLMLVGGKYDGWFMRVITNDNGTTIRLFKQMPTTYHNYSWRYDPARNWDNRSKIDTSDENLEWTNSKEFDLTSIKCYVYSPGQDTRFVVFDSFYEAAEYPIEQSFILMLLPPWYSVNEEGTITGFEETTYFGDIEVKLTAVDTIDNKIEYHLNENFVKKEEIDLYLFDLPNTNYSNGLLLDDQETYTRSWISENSPSPIPLYELFAKCKYRKYGRTIHRLKATILYDGILKVFAIFTDNNLQVDSAVNIEFILNGFTWNLDTGQYEIEAEEYTEEDIVVAGVSYDSEGNPDIYMPDPVTGLLLEVTAQGTGIWCRWDHVGGTLIGYQLQRKPRFSVVQNFTWLDEYTIVYDGSDYIYIDDIDATGPVTTGTIFTYRIRAYNGAGYGSWSDEETIEWTF